MVIAHDINQGYRTEDVEISENVTFDSMLLSVRTLSGLKKAGFFRPSPIQLHGIPIGKCGFDLLLEAKSGTGKTAVFSIIALEKTDEIKGLQSIILTPTREIAAQICNVIQEIGIFYEELNTAMVIGGMPVKEDIEKFAKNNIHIMVGSPGRIRHLIQDKHVDVSSVRLIVLDEADKLLESSFQPDINFIFSNLPQQKQVIMSSATYSESIKDIVKKYVNQAHHICPDTTSILLGIEQNVTMVEYNSNVMRQTQIRYKELLNIITKKQFKQCLIFCNYQARVTDLHKLLTRDKWPSEQLYGMQQQTDRLEALKTLQEYKCRILIATDLAARGIDASNVDLVINFEPPNDWQTYLHRIGRAGRYGSYGIAITILSEGTEERKFKAMLSTFKDCLKISHLWSQNPFSFDSDKIDLVLEKSKAHENNEEIKKHETKTKRNDLIINKGLSEVWNDITAQSPCNINIETFDKLIYSYINTFELDSFSRLLQSYEYSPCDSTTDESYVRSNLPEIDVENIISHLDFKYQKSSISIVTDKIINNNSQKEHSKNGIKDEINNGFHHEDEECNEFDEMAKLGLPTSFGSHGNCDNKNINDKVKSKKSPRNKCKKNQIDSTLEYKDDSTNIEMTDSSRIIQPNFTETPKSHSQSNHKIENKHEKNVPKRNSYTKRKCKNNDTLSDYNKWFRDIKLKTKQLEQMLYFEEMLK